MIPNIILLDDSFIRACRVAQSECDLTILNNTPILSNCTLYSTVRHEHIRTYRYRYCVIFESVYSGLTPYSLPAQQQANNKEVSQSVSHELPRFYSFNTSKRAYTGVRDADHSGP